MSDTLSELPKAIFCSLLETVDGPSRSDVRFRVVAEAPRQTCRATISQRTMVGGLLRSASYRQRIPRASGDESCVMPGRARRGGFSALAG